MALLAMVVSSPVVASGQSTLIVVGDDSMLERAIRIALEPWQIRVRRISEPEEPMSGLRASELVAAEDADQVVWIADATLWLHDASQDGSIGRRVEPIVDEASAAAVALTLKTLIRRPSVGEDPRREFALAVMTGARLLEFEPGRVEPRVDAFVTWSTTGLGLELQLGIELSIGAGARYSGASFDGYLWSGLAILGVGLEYRFERLVLAGGAGLGAQLAFLDATLYAPDESRSVWRLNPVLATNLALGLQVDSVDLLIRPRLDVPLIRQRFTVDGSESLVQNPVALELLLGIAAHF